jgi:hypothetical protein
MGNVILKSRNGNQSNSKIAPTAATLYMFTVEPNIQKTETIALSTNTNLRVFGFKKKEFIVVIFFDFACLKPLSNIIILFSE